MGSGRECRQTGQPGEVPRDGVGQAFLSRGPVLYGPTHSIVLRTDSEKDRRMGGCQWLRSWRGRGSGMALRGDRRDPVGDGSPRTSVRILPVIVPYRLLQSL